MRTMIVMRAGTVTRLEATTRKVGWGGGGGANQATCIVSIKHPHVSPRNVLFNVK